MKKSTKIILFCLASLAFIGCDRLTKNMAKEDLPGREPLTYFHDTFRLEYIENTGAALSLGDELPKALSFWLLSIVPLLVLTGLFVYSMININKLTQSKLVCFALIFAGGMGNVIDRMIYDRHVTDFMNVGIGSLRTGIFNVADMCVTAGAIGLLLFYKEKKTA
jgi:signal peptidase II